MARLSKSYVCQSCGATSGRWTGRCASCGAWNSISEETAQNSGIGANTTKHSRDGNVITLEGLSGKTKDVERIETGFSELDRVLGGGLVPGSAILVGGDPGIGKSTLLLQVTAQLAQAGRQTLYFSGEEASAQIRMRAKRLGLDKAPVKLAAETNLANILATLEAGADQNNTGKNGTSTPPDLVVIDSIQTTWSDDLDQVPGSISQLRHCAQSLIRFAKTNNAAIVLVGHVTKDGQIAGPKVIEHMVDTVLYFENDGGQDFRILRTVKNRFGATDEIGVFDMQAEGLKEVTNPSEHFLSERSAECPGTAVFAGMEGTRPLLIEIQALIAPSAYGTARRAVVGWDTNRLNMLIAVLDARCGIQLGNHDVFLNIAGGLKIGEPAADLAVAAALVSSFYGVSLPTERVYFGEVGLSGALRGVSQTTARLKEAQKLGFTSACLPKSKEGEQAKTELQLDMCKQLKDVTETFTSEAS